MSCLIRYAVVVAGELLTRASRSLSRIPTLRPQSNCLMAPVCLKATVLVEETLSSTSVFRGTHKTP